MNTADDAHINIVLIQGDVASVENIKVALSKFWKNFQVDLIVDVNRALQFVQRRNVFRSAQIPDLVILDLEVLNRMQEIVGNILWDPGLRLIPFILLCNQRCDENWGNLPVPVYVAEKPLTFEKMAHIFGRFLVSGMMEKQI